MGILEIDHVKSAEAAVAAAARHVLGGVMSSALYSPVGPRLAIPGGSALAAMHAVLREMPRSVRRQLHLMWVDERCVDPDDPASNYGAARRQGLVPDDCASVLPLWWAGATPDEVMKRTTERFARDYDSRIDVALLGLGEDGHIASLFPGRSAPHDRAFVVHVTDSPKPPAERMTMSSALLGEARLCVLLVLGEGKRAALRRVLAHEEGMPTRRLDRLIVVTDLAHEPETSR